MKWTEEKTRHSATIVDDDGHVRAEARVESTREHVPLLSRGAITESWWWHLEAPLGHGSRLLRFGGGSLSTGAEAMACAEKALDLVARIVETETTYIEVEIPSDKVDMVDHHGDYGAICLLCDKAAQQCLHDPAQVRLAFGLALRLGKHTPTKEGTDG